MRAVSLRLRPSRTAGLRPDGGSVAVEFALLLPLLMMFLFGIVQYGYGLFQLQNFNSVLTSATESASQGITDCPAFKNTLTQLADGNGLDPDDIGDVKVSWLNDLGQTIGAPSRDGRVQVTASMRPFKIGIPFVPFPDTITRTRTASVQDVIDPALRPLNLDLGRGLCL